MIALGSLEVVGVGNEDQRSVVVGYQAVDRERRKLLAALVEGKAHDHHVEEALGQHFLDAGMPYERVQMLAPAMRLG